MRPYGTDGSSWFSHPVIRTATENQKGLEYERLQSDNQTHETGKRLPCCLTVFSHPLTIAAPWHVAPLYSC